VLPVGRHAGPGGYDWSDASLARGVQDADAVIHLAGENLFGKRWTAKQKDGLRASRIEPTRKLARLVAARRPAAFISTSAVGYYGAGAGGPEKFAKLASGLDVAIVRVLNTRPGDHTPVRRAIEIFAPGSVT